MLQIKPFISVKMDSKLFIYNVKEYLYGSF